MLCLALGAAPAHSHAHGPLTPIRQCVRRGDTQGALTRIEALDEAQRGEPAVAYLRARLLGRLGRIDAALAALPEQLDALPEAVRHDVQERRALWLARSGDCARALPLLQRVHERTAQPETALRLAECKLAAGDAAGAVALFEATPTTGPWVDAVAAGLWHAEALLALGRRDEATALLRTLYVERPEHVNAELVEAALRAAGGSTALDHDERLRRAERFMRVRNPVAALRELDATKPPKARADRSTWLERRGMALYKQRTRYAEAAQVLARAARLGGPDAEEAEFHAARALARADQDGRAIVAFRRFAKRHPQHRRAGLATYLAAWLELRLGRARGGRAMQGVIDDPATPPARRRTARFELGMHELARGRHRRAGALFDAYASGARGAMVRGRGLYWAGRAAQLAGDLPTAKQRLREVATLEPLHWYALLARRRLKQLGDTLEDPFAHSDAAADAARPAAPLSEAPLPALTRFYAQLGLDGDAVAALTSKEPAVIAQAPSGRGLEALTGAYQRLGEYTRPLRMVRRRLGDTFEHRPTGTWAWAWDALLPRPHAAVVESLQKLERVPPGLLHAIMRKESLFDPGVVSYADAIGLMQLLPATARKVGGALGVEISREMLFDPETNVRLAAHLVGTLLRQFDGHVPLAVAAYNAGAHRVRPWLVRERKRAGGKVELDLFVERIPIEQTRNYVRRVVTNWARYRYLQDPAHGWPLELPDTL